MSRPFSWLFFGVLTLASSMSLAIPNSPESYCLISAYRDLADQALNLGCSISSDTKLVKIVSSETPNDRLVLITYSTPASCPQGLSLAPVVLAYDREAQTCR